jgi:hypothetical protein
MCELGRFLRQRGNCAKFVIGEHGMASKTDQHVDLPPETVRSMITERTFRMPLVSIKISEKLAVTEISLNTDSGNLHPISGFPRSIFRDESKALCRFLLITVYRETKQLTNLSQPLAVQSIPTLIGGQVPRPVGLKRNKHGNLQ